MRATLMVAQELLRCRLMESGRDALLECVTELLDAAAMGAPLQDIFYFFEIEGCGKF